MKIFTSLTCLEYHTIKITTNKALEVAIIAEGCIIQHIVHIMQPWRISHKLSQSGQSLGFFWKKELGEDVICIEIETTRGSSIVLWSINCQLFRCHLIEETKTVEGERMVGGHMKEIAIVSNKFPDLEQTTIILVIHHPAHPVQTIPYTIFALSFFSLTYLRSSLVKSVTSSPCGYSFELTQGNNPSLTISSSFSSSQSCSERNRASSISVCKPYK